MCDEAKGTVSRSFSVEEKAFKYILHSSSTPPGASHSSNTTRTRLTPAVLQGRIRVAAAMSPG